MTVTNLITRMDAICRKYDLDKQSQLNDVSGGGDDFARLHDVVEADFDATHQAPANERNRAMAFALNAEIRRTKARLLEEIPKLQMLALKKDSIKFLFYN